MIFSNVIAFFIILTTAAVLNAGGVTNIQSAAQAAEALRPLAGELTFLLFALGIVGTGLLAIPVLAGSAAYGVAEAFGWPASLEAKVQLIFMELSRLQRSSDLGSDLRASTQSKC